MLDALATDEAAEDAELIAVLLAWEPGIDIGDLAASSGLPPERVRAALTRLGTSGRVGYDTAEAAYFHRELPYGAAWNGTTHDCAPPGPWWPPEP